MHDYKYIHTRRRLWDAPIGTGVSLISTANLGEYLEEHDRNDTD